MARRKAHTETEDKPGVDRKANDSVPKKALDRSRARRKRAADSFGVTEEEYSEVHGAVAAVCKGFDAVAARNLVDYFYSRIRSGSPYCQDALLILLEHAFGKIINENESANTAFGLERKRGRPPVDQTFRDIRLAAAVILRMRQGHSWESSVNDVVEEFFDNGEGAGVTIRAHRYFHDTLMLLPDPYLHEIVRGEDIK